MTVAVQKKNKELINYLLDECSAEIDARNIDFTIPLHYAIASENVSMVKFLLRKKADPQAYAPEPEKINTPIAWAFECGNKYIIKILLKNIKDNVHSDNIDALHELAD